MGTPLVPFNEIDEACLSASTATGPFNIEVEVQLRRRLDVRRLRDAVSAAARVHPLARARLAPSGPFERRNKWQIVSRPDRDPLVVIDPGSSSGKKLRSDVLERLIPLEDAPPFRLVLTPSIQGDRLTLVMSHVASDGVGSLRLLRSIALAYSQEREPDATVGLLEARALDHHFARTGSRIWNRRMQAVGRAQLDAWLTPASRLARVAESATGGAGVHHVRIPKRLTALICERLGPATVNDLLLSALTRTIEVWNAKAGSRADRISLLVPLNLRRPGWRRDIVANLSLATVVTTRAGERDDDDDLVQAVVAQTAIAKADLASAGFADLYKVAAGAPNFWKRALSRVLDATTAPRMMPTAILSNVGAELDSLSFGRAGQASELWFSPPCPMPSCLGVGVVTYSGQLFVSLRYSPELLPPKAAATFGTLFGATLATIAKHDGARRGRQDCRRRTSSWSKAD